MIVDSSGTALAFADCQGRLDQTLTLFIAFCNARDKGNGGSELNCRLFHLTSRSAAVPAFFAAYAAIRSRRSSPTFSLIGFPRSMTMNTSASYLFCSEQLESPLYLLRIAFKVFGTTNDAHSRQLECDELRCFASDRQSDVLLSIQQKCHRISDRACR